MLVENYHQFPSALNFGSLPQFFAPLRRQQTFKILILASTMQGVSSRRCVTYPPHAASRTPPHAWHTTGDVDLAAFRTDSPKSVSHYNSIKRHQLACKRKFENSRCMRVKRHMAGDASACLTHRKSKVPELGIEPTREKRRAAQSASPRLVP